MIGALLITRINSPLPFMQDAESNPLCRRLQLKDIIPTQMQRLTKYPLLLDNIAKYTGQHSWKFKSLATKLQRSLKAFWCLQVSKS